MVERLTLIDQWNNVWPNVRPEQANATKQEQRFTQQNGNNFNTV